jgi:HEPN domain-containing protein
MTKARQNDLGRLLSGGIQSLSKSVSAETRDPWSLLSRAENLSKVGFLNEAVVASDEAVETGLKELFKELGVPQPIRREETVRILEEEGIKFSGQNLLHLRKLREKAEREEGENLTAPEVDEAISAAECFLSKINDQMESSGKREFTSRFKETSSRRREANLNGNFTGAKDLDSLLMLGTLDSSRRIHLPRRDAGQDELEFFTKLLLARTILDFKKKKIPHMIGLFIALLSAATCCLLFGIGGYGIIQILTGESLFSIFGLLFYCLLVFVSYVFLKIAIYVKNETR